jgi:hypothetical protein
VSIGPSIDIVTAGRPGRRTSSNRLAGALRLVAVRAGSLAFAVAAALSVVTPALGADTSVSAPAVRSTELASLATLPRVVAQQEPRDAFEGGLVPSARRIIVPNVELGLARERPIPVGVTCSCTIDRTGLVSQFDITVVEVVQDAFPMVQQLNRFNRPPRPGARYVAAYVGQQYIAGPENQAYTTTEADWKATATDGRLSDSAQLLHTEVEYRPKADVYPTNFVNGWLIYELPVNRPAFLVWNYNFVGERGIWFALQ